MSEPTPRTERAHAPEKVNTGSIQVRRIIPATTEELFDAWLDPESLAQWMHPGSEKNSIARVEPRVGGAFEVVMHYKPERSQRHYGEYRVIDRPAKLVFTWSSNATHHTETLVTVDFHPRGDAGTEIVVTHERMPNPVASLEHTQGWTLALDLLAMLKEHP